MQKNAPIGIFDSGSGGISVLRTALHMLPNERFLYFGDTANAPYGTKTEEDVITLAKRVAEDLLDQGCKALVIACNTATCAAAATLRAMYPDLIIIGMEPALKLAHDLRPEGDILVLATPVSLSSDKYRQLYTAYGEHAHSLPCPGLMDFVERGDIDSDELKSYLLDKLSPFLKDGNIPAAVVLGCTHYVFLKKTIASLLPKETLVLDGNEGTVRQLRRRLEGENLLSDTPPSADRALLSTSGDASALQLMHQLLHLPV